MSVNPVIFEDQYKVTSVDPAGKKYLRVSRIVAKADTLDIVISVDINSDIYPITAGERITIALAHTLDLDGQRESEYYDHSVYHRESLMSQYDYVMHGQVFECNTDDQTLQKVYALASFGGLLMKVEGSVEVLRDVSFNKKFYILIKKGS